jgi:hypothetical protein
LDLAFWWIFDRGIRRHFDRPKSIVIVRDQPRLNPPKIGRIRV